MWSSPEAIRIKVTLQCSISISKIQNPQKHFVFILSLVSDQVGFKSTNVTTETEIKTGRIWLRLCRNRRRWENSGVEKWQLSYRTFSENWSWWVIIGSADWKHLLHQRVFARMVSDLIPSFPPQYSLRLCNINLSRCSMTSVTQPIHLFPLSLGPNTCSYQESVSSQQRSYSTTNVTSVCLNVTDKDFIWTESQTTAK